MHFLFYLHVPSQTRFTVLWTYLSGVWYQNLMAISAYLSLNVQPAATGSDTFSASWYIRKLSGQSCTWPRLSPLAGWTVVHGFSLQCCSFWHCQSSKVSSVDKCFTFLQLLEGTFQFLGCLEGFDMCVSYVSITGFVSSTALLWVWHFTVQKPDSHLSPKWMEECF